MFVFASFIEETSLKEGGFFNLKGVFHRLRQVYTGIKDSTMTDMKGL